MANYIIKLADDKYIEWSTVVDAPASSVMSEQDCLNYLRKVEERQQGLQYETDSELIQIKKDIVDIATKKRWERIKLNGTSSLDGFNLESIKEYNRAGPRECKLTIEKIIELYTYDERNKKQFPWS